MTNIFELAEVELIREQIKPGDKNYTSLLLDRAIRIRKYFDYQARGKEISKAKTK